MCMKIVFPVFEFNGKNKSGEKYTWGRISRNKIEPFGNSTHCTNSIFAKCAIYMDKIQSNFKDLSQIGKTD